MNRTARRPGAQQAEGGRRMGRILTVLPPFELLRPGTGRGPAKPRFRGSKRELPFGEFSLYPSPRSFVVGKGDTLQPQWWCGQVAPRSILP
jgi:hypothetical protein